MSCKRGQFRVAAAVAATVVLMGSMVGVAQAAPPVASGSPAAALPLAAPSVATTPLLTPSGTASVGSTLTLQPGSWSGATSTSDVWQRCSASDAACASLSPQPAGSTYTATSDDVGHTIAVTETATGSGGSTVATTNYVSVPAADTVAPTVSGREQVGQVLTASNGSWNFTPSSYAYQWYRCTTSTTCTAISSATTSSYTTALADLGDTLYVQVTANGTAGGSAVSPVSNAAHTLTIVPPTPTNRAAPTISGTAQSGQTLTAGLAAWTTDPSYILQRAVQWSRCDSSTNNCSPVPDATGASLTLGPTDAGATIQVCESAAYLSGDTRGAFSAPVCSGFTSPVTDAAGVVPIPALSGGAPTLSGTPQLGGSLTATHASFSGNPASDAFQWRRCKGSSCTDIPGATSLTYALTAGDVGYGLQFVESATNSKGSGSAQSAISPAVTAPSTTSLQTSSGIPSAGEAVSLIAAVSTAAPPSAEAGTIRFTSDGKPIGGCRQLPLPANPTQPVICRAAFTAAHHSLVASFTPAPGTYVTRSASGAVALPVERAATTIALSGTARVLLGRTSTYRATLRPRPSGVLSPRGRVTFLDGGRAISGCAKRALHDGVATCPVRYAGLRRHAIAVRYSGDANFAPSHSGTQRVTVTPQAPTGVVTSYMSWTFAFSPQSTGIQSLTVSGLVKGTRISMTCSGVGCAFHTYSRTVTAPRHCRAGHGCRPPSSVDLTPVFAHHRLHVGANLIVRLSHPGWLGKYYRFTIRSGRKPILHASCLAVGGTRPSVGCTAGA